MPWVTVRTPTEMQDVQCETPMTPTEARDFATRLNEAADFLDPPTVDNPVEDVVFEPTEPGHIIEAPDA